MSHATVTPAYGRDYTSANKASADWASGKDFILRDPTSPWDGKYINEEDARNAGIAVVNIRYAGLTKVTVVHPKDAT